MGREFMVDLLEISTESGFGGVDRSLGTGCFVIDQGVMFMWSRLTIEGT